MSAKLSLLNFISVYKSVLNHSTLHKVLQKCESLNWKPHEWTNYDSVTPSPQPEYEFLRADLVGIEKNLLFKVIYACILEYCKVNNFYSNGNSPIVINKYEQGKQLIEHIDHKTNYFVGANKGIPILTVIGLLNSNYSGGILTLCKDYQITLDAGDLVIFPSNFMFPHSISKVETGIRYSFNQWFW